MTRNTDLLWITALTVLGLALRLWHINTDLWLDEIMTLVEYMRMPPFDAVGGFHAPNQHFLNSFLGSISIRLFGESAWSVRLPAMLFGVATIPVFYRLASLVTKQRETIFSTLVLTVSYHHVWFSQNARGYSAMIFFTVASTLLLLQWLRQSDSRPGIIVLGFVICSCLGILSLLNYAFVVAAQCVVAFWFLLVANDRQRIRHVLYAGLVVLLLSMLSFTSVLPEMLDYFGGSDGGIKNLGGFFSMLIKGLGSGLSTMAIPAILAAAAVALMGCASYWRGNKLIVLLLFLPAVFNVIALIVLGFGWFPRSFLYVLPFSILIVVRGCFVAGNAVSERLNRFQGLQYLLPVLLLLASVVMLSHNYRYPKQDCSGSLAYTRSMAAPDDVIAVVGYLEYSYKYYFAPELAFPKDLEQLQGLRGPNHQVWVLYSYTRFLNRQQPDALNTIKTSYKKQRVFPGTLGDGTIYLYKAPPIPVN